MGAIHTPCATLEQLLEHQSEQVRQRLASNQQSFGVLTIRKFPTRLEPVAYISADSDIPFDRVRFDLFLNNTREEWKLSMDMIFHTRRRLLSDGSMVDPGLQFNVVDEEGKSLFVDYVSVEPSEELEAMSPEQWALHWFQKIARRPDFSAVFAHKEFVQELDD